MLSIHLLGSPQILLDGAAVELPRRRSRALVYYLAAQPGPVSRELLLLLFWPDHERSAAQQLLRTTLHGIRKALGAALVTGDDQIAIGPEVAIDLRQLTEAIQAPADYTALADALAMYRDEFLAGFSLPDCEQFEEWMHAERERIRLLVMRGLNRLAQFYQDAGEYAEAIGALTRALSFDPLQEDLQRAAMRMHYLAGDRVAAIRRYEQLRDLLDDEIGVPPMAETRALYDAIITDSLPVEPQRRNGGLLIRREPFGAIRYQGAPIAAQLPFTGRDSELESLLSSARAGRLLLIEGDTGIGKTRLAEEFLNRYGCFKLIGTARELEQNLPYQPVVSALRSLLANQDWADLRAQLELDPIWLREVARLLPELAPTPDPLPPADETRIWEAVTRLLVALARKRSITLLIDDLQWADATTIGLIGYLLRRSEAAELSLMATTRPVEPRSTLGIFLNALTREGRLERISLNRLSSVETLALAKGLSELYAQPLADWLERNAEGNPYIMKELLDHARASQMLLPDGTVNLNMLSLEPVVPQSVYSLIQSRLVRLSDGAQRVLNAAVAAGREFDFEIAARAAALSESAALDALDELRAARIIEPIDVTRFRFDHSLTMEVARREVGEPRYRLMHRRVAEALEAAHRNRIESVAGLIASHFIAGGQPERASNYAMIAGKQAALVAAWSEAINFYEQALIGVDDAQRAPILLVLGDALLHQGATVKAVEYLQKVLALAETPEVKQAAHIALAQAMVAQNEYAQVIRLVNPLEQFTSVANTFAALFLWGTALSLEGADLPGAAERLHMAEQTIASQPNGGAPELLARVRFELGSVMAQQGDLVKAIAYYHEAMVVADAADRPSDDRALTWRILARNNLAYHLHLLGDLTEAERQIAAAQQIAEQRGAIGIQPYLFSTSGEIAMARGDLDQAEKLFQQGLNLASRVNIPERVAGITANLGLIALRRGQTNLARKQLSQGLAQADELGTRHLAAQIRIWLAPLLPSDQARVAIAEARAIAEHGGRQRLLEQIAQLELGAVAPA